MDTGIDGSPEAKKMFGRTDEHTGYGEAGSTDKAAYIFGKKFSVRNTGYFE
jgi:hypothetical protein